ELAAVQPGRLGRARGRGKRRVEDVDVDRQVDGTVADLVAQPPGDGRQAGGIDVLAGNDAEAHLGIIAQVPRPVQGPADAHVRAVAGNEQAFLGGAAERRPVGVPGAEVARPRVQVRVEVHEGYRPVSAGGRPQQRQ